LGIWQWLNSLDFAGLLRDLNIYEALGGLAGLGSLLYVLGLVGLAMPLFRTHPNLSLTTAFREAASAPKPTVVVEGTKTFVARPLYAVLTAVVTLVGAFYVGWGLLHHFLGGWMLLLGQLAVGVIVVVAFSWGMGHILRSRTSVGEGLTARICSGFEYFFSYLGGFYAGFTLTSTAEYKAKYFFPQMAGFDVTMNVLGVCFMAAVIAALPSAVAQRLPLPIVRLTRTDETITIGIQVIHSGGYYRIFKHPEGVLTDIPDSTVAEAVQSN
jgi:hypothetical protein